MLYKFVVYIICFTVLLIFFISYCIFDSIFFWNPLMFGMHLSLQFIFSRNRRGPLSICVVFAWICPSSFKGILYFWWISSYLQDFPKIFFHDFPYWMLFESTSFRDCLSLCHQTEVQNLQAWKASWLLFLIIQWLQFLPVSIWLMGQSILPPFSLRSKLYLR